MARPDDEPNGAPSPAPASAAARLELLYRDQAPQLRRRLSAQLRSSEDAGDLVQDAFARLLGSEIRHALRHPEAFLNRIVRNLLIDRSRRLATRATHVPVDEEAGPSVRPTQADSIELTQTRTQYRAAVDALPERMREVFLLHRTEGLSYKEIAGRLGISTRTVEWHIAEALIRIAKGLEGR